MTQNEEKRQSILSESEMAKMPELAGKDDETVFTTAWCAFEKLKGTWRTSDRQGDTQKEPNQASRQKSQTRSGGYSGGAGCVH